MLNHPKVKEFEWKPGENDIEYIRKLRGVLDDNHKLTQEAISKMRKMAREYKPVIHTEWVFHEDGSATCPNCNYTFNDIYLGVDCYCRHCGAAMDGGVNL